MDVKPKPLRIRKEIRIYNMQIFEKKSSQIINLTWIYRQNSLPSICLIAAHIKTIVRRKIFSFHSSVNLTITDTFVHFKES